MGYILAVCLFAGLAVVWLMGGALTSRRRRQGGHEWLPVRLAERELVWSEKTFRCEAPIPMVARIDRAYLSDSRQLTLVDFKRRAAARTYQSDVVELSVQRYVMQKAGHPVSRHAYLVVVPSGGGRSRALPVELEDARTIERRIARWSALMAEDVPPERTANLTLCRRCGHVDRCTGKRLRSERGAITAKAR